MEKIDKHLKSSKEKDHAKPLDKPEQYVFLCLPRITLLMLTVTCTNQIAAHHRTTSKPFLLFPP